jgi:CCR4-NOT complex subunit CAF16
VAPTDSSRTGSAAVEVAALSYRYGTAPVLSDISLQVATGSRCLLVGANGAGKSTLLRILAGQHLLPRAVVQVLGRPAFHDTSLVNDITYLGVEFPFDADVVVADLLMRFQPYPERLVEVLGIDPRWHMHRLSDGQRRRVQIVMGLARRPQVLLLDEVTSDLDVLARHELLELLRQQSVAQGLTVIYATHIFDGLDNWATDLIYLSQGRLALAAPLEEIPELVSLRAAGADNPLHRLVVGWLRDEAESSG